MGTWAASEFLAEVVKINEAQIIHDGLGPNDDVTALKNELISGRQDIMIVGHLHFLSKLASLLLTGCEASNTVAFKQAGIVCLDYSDDNQWQLDWMIIPELLV